MEKLTEIILLKFFIYYGSWLVFPFLYFLIKKKLFIKSKSLIIFLSFMSCLFIYARFVEPKILLVNNYKINTGFKVKFALISDIHLGIYNNSSILERTVEKINKLNVDAVLIAGDFTYEPQFTSFDELFKSLKNIKYPVYAVLGNHDVSEPGPNIEKELITYLESIGVNIITNKAVNIKGITLLGLGSHWHLNDKTDLLKKYKQTDNVVVLTHNPDTALYYPENYYPDITLAGHTHGGQIRIPYIYKKIIPVIGSEVLWNQGLYNYRKGKVFVTSGIGEIGLPLRFLIPPTIDIIELY